MKSNRFTDAGFSVEIRIHEFPDFAFQNMSFQLYHRGVIVGTVYDEEFRDVVILAAQADPDFFAVVVHTYQRFVAFLFQAVGFVGKPCLDVARTVVEVEHPDAAEFACQLQVLAFLPVVGIDGSKGGAQFQEKFRNTYAFGMRFVAETVEQFVGIGVAGTRRELTFGVEGWNEVQVFQVFVALKFNDFQEKSLAGDGADR